VINPKERATIAKSLVNVKHEFLSHNFREKIIKPPCFSKAICMRKCARRRE